ncbi:MAG: ComEC/Rec2 family competence protein, partial [Longimicrobiales bacterium]
LLVRLEDTAAIAAAVPGGHVYVTRATVIASLLALLPGYLVWRNFWFIRSRMRLATACGVACTVPIATPFLSRVSRDSIEIHAIDVGQGDAIAVRSPRGRWLLIDAGPRSDRFDAGAARVVPFLLRHHARALEVLVLTHPHLDHVGGAPAVTAILETRLLLDPDSGRGIRAALGEAALEGATGRWLPARPGTRVAIDGMVMEILHPTADELGAEDANDISVVVRLGFGQFAALFTGDAPARIEEQLLQQYGARLDVDLLKIGHHGSRTSTGAEWLAGSSPRYALISAGRGNRYGHPSPAVIDRLEQAGVEVFRTDRSGNISLRAFADGRVEVFDR